MYKASLRHAPKLQKNDSDWMTLSINESLSVLDEVCELPSIASFINILCKCRKKKSLPYAKRLHAHICNYGLQAHRSIANHLVPIFVECGSVLDAQHIFSRLVYQNEHSWTSLIAGYVQFGNLQHALMLYHAMQGNRVPPSRYTLMAVLRACAGLKDVEKGREIHIEIIQKGFDRDLLVGNILVDMYAKCNLLIEAHKALEKLPVRDVVSWNTIIAGHVDHGCGQEALRCFEEMQLEGISPDSITFICALKACVSIRIKDKVQELPEQLEDLFPDAVCSLKVCCMLGAIKKVREIHMKLVKQGFERDIFVGNTLVTVYAKCGSLSEAREVFDKLPVRDVILWTSLIAGYTQYGPIQEAFDCFEEMQHEDISPDATTFVCILKACINLGALNKGRELHAAIIKEGFDRELFVGNSLINMYAKFGMLSEAQKVFDNLPVRDVVSWNVLIAGYAEHAPSYEALACFDEMRSKGVTLDVVTFVCALKACGRIGAIDRGREIHDEIVQKGFEEKIFIGNSLVDMYAKCGSLSEARKAFDKLLVRDVVSWNALMNGYGMNHETAMALRCFESMQKEGVKPDAITFTCLFTAFSHASLVHKGREFFKVMKEEYGIIPTTDHYSCMIDLYARSGLLYDAEKLVARMSCPPVRTWTCLLSACKTYGQTELGLKYYKHLVQSNPEYASAYVLMADIYVNSGRNDDAYRIEEMRRYVGANKKRASACIEINNEVYQFVIGDNPSKEVLAMLEFVSSCKKQEGHVPNLDLIYGSITDDQEKEESLCEHAEKLAIAFGLLNTPQGHPLHVTKNLRMCSNCHIGSKAISSIYRREIIVRDGYHIHHFKDGLCSCRDIF